jgi:hypothetical protein
MLNGSDDFFTAPSKDERIAAFKPCDSLSLQRMLDDQLIDPRLTWCGTARKLAHINSLGIRPRFIKQLARSKPIIKHNIRFAQQAQSLHRDQFWIARACTDEREVAS